jgi:hypothetical protein
VCASAKPRLSQRYDNGVQGHSYRAIAGGAAPGPARSRKVFHPSTAVCPGGFHKLCCRWTMSRQLGIDHTPLRIDSSQDKDAVVISHANLDDSSECSILSRLRFPRARSPALPASQDARKEVAGQRPALSAPSITTVVACATFLSPAELICHLRGSTKGIQSVYLVAFNLAAGLQAAALVP